MRYVALALATALGAFAAGADDSSRTLMSPVRLAPPAIAVGGVVSSCRAGSHGVDGITDYCGSSPAARAHRVVPGETIEIRGTGLAPVRGEAVSAIFRQYTEASTEVSVQVSSGVVVVSVNQVNVAVPAGLRAGLAFVSLKFATRGETNADGVELLGPVIASDGIQSWNPSVRDDLYPGAIVTAIGRFSPTKYNQAYVDCGTAFPKAKADQSSSSASQVGFRIPLRVPPRTRCSLTVHSGSIESAPVHFMTSARALYEARVGLYQWDTAYDPMLGVGTSTLSAVKTQAAAIGARTLRVYLGPNAACSGLDSYHYTLKAGEDCAASSSLTRLAQRADYDALFASPDIDTFLLTAYTIEGTVNAWTSAVAWAASQAFERAELQALARYLGNRFPAKQFVVLDWEGDHALLGWLSSQVQLDVWTADAFVALYDRYVEWVKNRALGVRAAGMANVRIATEFSLSWRAMLGQSTTVVGSDCHVAQVPQSVLGYVIPRVSRAVDFVSFSAYDSLNDPASDPLLYGGASCNGLPSIVQSEALSWDLGRNLTVLLDYFRVRFGAGRLLIGEYGFDDRAFLTSGFEGLFGGDGIRQATQRTINVAIAGGAEYAIGFQFYDVPTSTSAQGFGIFDGSGAVKWNGGMRSFYRDRVYRR